MVSTQGGSGPWPLKLIDGGLLEGEGEIEGA